MDFLNRVKEAALDVAGKTEKKSKEIYSVAKLRLAIADKQSNVKRLYKEIGYTAYIAYKEKADIAQATAAKLEKVDALEDEIAELRKKIDETRALSPEGVEDIPVSDDSAEDADFEEAPADEAPGEDDAEPIEPIE